MKKITKKKAIEKFKIGEKIHSYRKINGMQAITWDPTKPHVSIQSLIDRDGRKFDFCTGVV